MFTSPLRYPGGKQKVASLLFNYFPKNFKEFREPFVGGGSIFIYTLQQRPDAKIWINDLNPELYYFWQQAQNNLPELIKMVKEIKHTAKNGKNLFKLLRDMNTDDLPPVSRASRFFILNRISFSGLIEAGGYSESAFQGRFTKSVIDKLAELQNKLDNIQITNLDYSEIINQAGDGVFLYLDPPYLKAMKSRLYGKKGCYHTEFDHQKFADIMKQCRHKWLITYDNCPEIRNYFKFANIQEWKLQYSMRSDQVKELIITNY